MTKAGDGLAHLLVLGVFLHALYVLSIFDIYFTSPVVEQIESIAYTDSPPAKRVVVFVADGCRADKFFETNASTTARRVSFLRNIIETQGSWGVSHTRVPTESRPGHVALFAGMYEDVSAVTKGWADNPVDFDSIFNQSRAAFLFGSPDIVPMFARHVPHAHEDHYSHSEEDFAHHDASQLDVWVYHRLQTLLRAGTNNEVVRTQLRAHGVVVFCHYLGIDSNGHAHRPTSKAYLNNIALVDELVAKSYRLVEDYYDHDGRTAYVFTADHGMSLKGAHGDGDPANTRTPLVVWGAGVQGPTMVHPSDQFAIYLPTQSRAHVRAQLQAQAPQEQQAIKEWGSLSQYLRKDVMQADIAPLLSALVGLPYPRNSVGVLPFAYLAKGAYRANAVRSNARQLYQHALRKEQEKESRTLWRFEPYHPFRDRGFKLLQALGQANDDENDKVFHQIEVASQELIDICLRAVDYFQRYDWFFLLGSVVWGYIGWIIVVITAYMHPHCFTIWWLLGPLGKQLDIKLLVGLFAAFMYLALEHSPVTYYLYVAFPLVFSVFTWNHAPLMHEAWGAAWNNSAMSRWTHAMELVLILVCLELVVWGYNDRAIFGLLFLLLAFWPYVGTAPTTDTDTLPNPLGFLSPTRSWSVSCALLSIFSYLPTEYGQHTALVHIGGLCTVLLTGAIRKRTANTQMHWKASSFVRSALPLILSLVTLHQTMQCLDGERSKPPLFLTLANWLLAGTPLVAVLVNVQQSTREGQLEAPWDANLRCQVAVRRSVKRLVEVMLAFAPSFLLLSIAYEMLFYVVLCAVLVSWLRLEAQASRRASMWREVQRAFVFLLLVNIAFFGTGNVASMSSFEISSTYRFVTVFAPFTMGALLIGKILIPFMIVACTFHLILLLPTKVPPANAMPLRLPATRYFLLVVAMSDLLALHFLFLVKNEGSWKEIGNSISMFGIVNAQIVFIPVLFLSARAFVRGLLPRTTDTSHYVKKQS